MAVAPECRSHISLVVILRRTMASVHTLPALAKRGRPRGTRRLVRSDELAKKTQVRASLVLSLQQLTSRAQKPKVR